MAAAITNLSRGVPGSSIDSTIILTGDTSYPTGGYVITAATFGLTLLRGIKAAFFTTIAGAAFEVAVVPTFNADGVTLASVAVALVVGTTGAQVAAAVDVHTVGIQLVATGN